MDLMRIYNSEVSDIATDGNILDILLTIAYLVYILMMRPVIWTIASILILAFNNLGWPEHKDDFDHPIHRLKEIFKSMGRIINGGE